MTYSHASEDWTVPLHFTVGRTIINGRPWKFEMDLNYFVVCPSAIAPEWMVGLNAAPVVENVLARWFAAH